MSRFFVYLNNWNSFDWRGELVGKRGWCCSYRFAWAWWVNEERSSTRPQQPLRTNYFKTQATLVHCDCAMVNQELLCLKLPSACLPMVYMRVFTRSSGISTQRQQWARVSLHFAWAIRWSPSTFALHLPISVLNDRLFLNRPWLMMSNPKIPSNTVFAFSFFKLQPSNKLSQLSPLLHFNKYCMSASPMPTGLTGADERAAQWITMSRNDALKKNSEREGCRHALWSSFSLFCTSASPRPLLPAPSCVYANSLCWKRTTGNDTPLTINGTISFCLSHPHDVSVLIPILV